MTNLDKPTNSAYQIYRRVVNLWMIGLTCLATLCALGALLFVLTYVVKSGFSSLNLNIFTTDPTPPGMPGGGLRNAIAGTLLLIGMASVIGLPLGILGGIYQIESRGRFATTVRFFTDVLNSIPSIVIGLFVYVVVVVPTAQLHPGQAYSAFAGSIALGIIMIPTVMRTTEEILSYRLDGGFAGAWSYSLSDYVEHCASRSSRRNHYRSNARNGKDCRRIGSLALYFFWKQSL
jgi:phosphate transport system permease protein